MSREVTGKGIDAGVAPLESGVDTRPASPSSLGLSAARRSSPAGDRSGKLVAGRYRVLDLLGRGGMGSVWLALDRALARTVAIKEVTEYETTTPATPESPALREARAASRVSHPGVVQVYDLVAWGGREWIVMEALSGTTLAQAIRLEGSLSVERVVDIGLRLLEALQALHREGVIHGDLKPSNVQLSGTGRPVLTDFGLASGPRDAASGEHAYFGGSPPYMAPETVLTGTRSVASDLFSLGATLYEAAEGRRPFDKDSPIATALAVLSDSPTPAVHGTPLGEVIDGLLIKDPHGRLSAQDAYARLKEIESEMIWLTPRSDSPVSATAC